MFNTEGRIKTIADHYGLDSQLNILQEELAELIQAVSKYRRNGSSDIIEEIADVFIMIDQVIYLLNKTTDQDLYYFIALHMDKKLRRQINRIKEEEVADNDSE